MVEDILPFKPSSWTFVEQAALRFRAKARCSASPGSRRRELAEQLSPSRCGESSATRGPGPGAVARSKVTYENLRSSWRRGWAGCARGSLLWRSEGCGGVNKCVKAFLPWEQASGGERVQRESFWGQQLTSWGAADPEPQDCCAVQYSGSWLCHGSPASQQRKMPTCPRGPQSERRKNWHISESNEHNLLEEREDTLNSNRWCKQHLRSCRCSVHTLTLTDTHTHSGSRENLVFRLKFSGDEGHCWSLTWNTKWRNKTHKSEIHRDGNYERWNRRGSREWRRWPNTCVFKLFSIGIIILILIIGTLEIHEMKDMEDKQ